MKTTSARHGRVVTILGWALLASAGCSGLTVPTTQLKSSTGPAVNAAAGERYEGPKARLSVASFTVKAPRAKDVGGDGLADMLATALFESNRYIVLERHALAVATVHTQRADLLVFGAVTEFEPDAAGGSASAPDRGANTKPAGGKKKSGKPTFGNILGSMTGGVAVSHVAIDLRVVDARTSRVVAATKVEGKATDFDLSGLEPLAGSKLGVGLSAHARTPMEKAIRLAIHQAVEFVSNETPATYYRYRDTDDAVVATPQTPGPSPAPEAAGQPSAAPRTGAGTAAAPRPSPTPGALGALPTPPAKVLYIKAAAANVRGGPSREAAVLTTVKRTTRVVVLENGNAWYRVKLENGREGWVAASVTSTEPQH
jgi:curli biogenesis system outer membrane secretion channel CsgG